MRVQVSLYSDDAERFENVREQLKRELGYEPDRADVVRFMMSQFDPDEFDVG